MHRVNQKRKQAAMLRIVAYGIIMTLSIVTTIVLLYVALGYRFDRQSGDVVRTGLLLVNNKPQAANVFINNERKTEAPGRFVLSAGSYDLALKLDGYRDWSKKVQITASGVREVNYPLLIPNTLTPREIIASVNAPSVISQSQDRKHLITFTNGQSVMQLVELNSKEPVQTSLELGQAFTRENGQLGTFRVVEWALNNKQILFEHTLASGKTEFISFDITRPAEAVNISNLYGNESIRDIHYVGGETKLVYGLSGTNLKTYQLEKSESTTVLQDVVNYQPYGDDTILFTRAALGSQHEVGIWQDKVATVIQSNIDPSIVSELSYARYEDNYYFAVAYSNGDTVTVYRNPLKKPILAKQLPLTVLKFEKPQKLKFSDSAQFFTVQNGNSFLTYDLEDKLQYRVTAPFDLAEGTSFSWADSSRLQAVAADGITHLVEYDGLNQQALVAPKPGTRLYFAPNYQHMYRLHDVNGATKMEVVSLINGKQ